MNDNTRRQWERYCADNPDLDVCECAVLYWLVHMHSAREGFTRPGVQLLALKSHADRKTVMRVLRRLWAYGAIELKEPAVGRLAALWTIPWLINVAVPNGTTKGTTKGTTSKGLRPLPAHAVAASRARHPSFAEQFQAKPRPEIAGYDDCAPDQFLIR